MRGILRFLPLRSPCGQCSALSCYFRLPACPRMYSLFSQFSAFYALPHLPSLEKFVTVLSFLTVSVSTMTSADFLRFSHTSPHGLLGEFFFFFFFSPRPTSRSPRVSTQTFPSSIRRIYTMGFVQCWTLSCLADSSVPYMPYMRFLFVGPRVCLRLPSDSTSRWTPLPSANSSHCKACNGLSPSSLRTCRAHQKKGDADASPLTA